MDNNANLASMSDTARPRVLLIEDDPDDAADITAVLESRLRIEWVSSAARGLEQLDRLAPDVVLLDVDLGIGATGLDLLIEIRRREDPPPVIMLTGDERIETVVEAVRRGAYDYLTKPPAPDRTSHVVNRAIEDHALRRKISLLEEKVDSLAGREFVTQDERMRHVLRQVEKVARTETTVLITGESGTGKELIAGRIHRLSKRRDGPFATMNCAAVPEGMMESTLFGHEKGAFTGATDRRKGLFERAKGGTILLDELQDSPPPLQVKLLRVLEERTFECVGGETTLQADVRILAATSRNVEDLVHSGDLRQELYYRLNVYRIHIPPLRERPDDVLPIAHHFVRRFAEEQDRCIRSISPAAEAFLRSHTWPGNIRDLRNAINRAVIECEGEELDLPHFADAGLSGSELTMPYHEAKSEMERRFQQRYLMARLREAQGNVTEAARRSGLKRQSFQVMIRACGLDAAAFRSGVTRDGDD